VNPTTAVLICSLVSSMPPAKPAGFGGDVGRTDPVVKGPNPGGAEAVELEPADAAPVAPDGPGGLVGRIDIGGCC
jgi:hypothetical protein